jgi:hypothetical protein
VCLYVCGVPVWSTDYVSTCPRDEDCDAECVVPLVLGTRPGTRDYWREFRNLHLDSFEGFPQAALDHLPSKMLNSLTCTDSLADLFKKKGGLFAPSRP